MSFAYLFKSLSVRKNEDDNNYMVTTPIKTYRIIYACIQVSRHYKFQNTTPGKQCIPWQQIDLLTLPLSLDT